jgi:ribosomal protein S18 acetylase RimI-like enzyme
VTDLTNIEIRRVFLPEDTQQIQQMQSQAAVFHDHYPKHLEWLRKALPEVLSGKRIAFGVYRSGINIRHLLSFDLVGSVILKVNHFKGVAELKNLFVREDSRNKGYGKALLNKAADYCQKAGFRVLDTEVPASELSTVSFLHRCGFTVGTSYSSPYKHDELLYRMSRSLPPRFIGDIFDFRAFCRWLLAMVFGFEVKEHTEHAVRIELPERLSTSAIPRQDRGVLRGLALIEDGLVDARDIAETFRGERVDLRFVFCRALDPVAKATCDDLAIALFDADTVRRLFGPHFAHKVMDFQREDIGGFVLNINRNIFATLPTTQSGFSLFKNGAVGKYLEGGHRLLLVSEPSVDHPLGGVAGVALVEESYVGSPQEVWDRFSKQTPLFDSAQFDSYTREHPEVLAVRVSQFSRVPLIDYHILVQDIIGGDVDIAELGCCYLSNRMVQRFERLVQPPQKGELVQYDVALSFAGEDRTYAMTLATLLTKRGVRVFYDGYEEADLWGKDLFQHFQVVYRDRARYCVVFLSQHYAKRLWTNHELRQAQARAFTQRAEYILPVKLDDTEIPGINKTVGYEDLRRKSVQDIADILVAKLARGDSVS